MILFSHFVYRLLGEKTHYLSAQNRSFKQAPYLQSDSGAQTSSTEGSLQGRTGYAAGQRKAYAEQSYAAGSAEQEGRNFASEAANAGPSPREAARTPDNKHTSMGDLTPCLKNFGTISKNYTQSKEKIRNMEELLLAVSQNKDYTFTKTLIVRSSEVTLPQVRSSETTNELFVICKKKNIFRFIFFLFKRCKGVEACASFMLESAPKAQLLVPAAEISTRSRGGAGPYLEQEGQTGAGFASTSPRSNARTELNIGLISSYLLKGNNFAINLYKLHSNLVVWACVGSAAQASPLPFAAIAPLRNLCLELASRQLSAAVQLGRKVVERPWLLQILFIPYVIFFGYFFTSIFLQLGGDLFIYSMLGSTGFGEHSARAGLRYGVAAFQALAEQEVRNFGSEAPNTSLLQVFASLRTNLSPFLRTCATDVIGTSSFMVATEFLRAAHYASKIFLVWSFLTIWKGIRPGQSTKNEYIIQVRINTKTKKRLSDLEGISKFLPLLETCIQSLKNQSPLRSAVAQVVQIQWDALCAGFAGALPLRSYASKNVAQAQLRSAAELRSTKPARSRANPAATRKYPKGYLFIGPPGTGKTLLAQAVAGEAGVPFIGLSASEIQKQISLGTKIGAVRLRNLFLQVKQHTPCILFFDEIDSIANRGQSFEHPNTGAGFASSGLNTDPGKTYTKRTSIKSTSIRPPGDITLFTEFLIQMDGVQPGLVIIGTTNFLNHLDSAFIRSGRFDRILGLTYPGKNTRIDLLRLYTRDKTNLGAAQPRGGAISAKGRGEACAALPTEAAPQASQSVATQSRGEARAQTSQSGATQRLNAYSSADKSEQSPIGLMYFAEKTNGWTAADLATLVNESFLYLCHQKLLSQQANHFLQIGNIRATTFSRLLRSFYQRKPKFPLVHTYKSLAEGMKKISTREKYFQGPKKE